MPEKGSPGGEVADHRHGDRADYQEQTGEIDLRFQPENSGRKCEGEVNKSEAEEGDMAEAGEAPAVGGVAAHPVFAMEEKTDDGAGDDAGHHGPPAGADGECDDLLHIN